MSNSSIAYRRPRTAKSSTAIIQMESGVYPKDRRAREREIAFLRQEISRNPRAHNTQTSTALSSGSSIHMLPPELLCEIFIDIVPEVNLHELVKRKNSHLPDDPWLHPNTVRLMMSRVCRRWRSVLELCPQAWTTIVADVDSPRKAMLVDRCIQLSKNLPLDIYLWPSKWNWIEMGSQTIVNLLRTQVHRIRTFCELGIQNDRKFPAHFNGLYIMNTFREAKYSAPNLRKLAIVGPGTYSIRFQNIKWDAPLLEHVLVFPRFLDCTFIRNETIQELDIALDTMTPLVSLQFLRACENIHTLRLIQPVSPASYWLYKNGPIILDCDTITLLPKLKVLQISGREILLIQLFHSLRTPALEKLIYRGLKRYLDNRRSFATLRWLLQNEMPNLHSLHIERVDSLTSKWAEELYEWDMITSLEITECDFVDGFLRRLRANAKKGPLVCPDLTSLKMDNCQYMTLRVICKTILSRLDSLESIDVKTKRTNILLRRSLKENIPVPFRRLLTEKAGLKQW
ncbi:hypothetical protein M422DRAFT_238937 [Sphaerobolus stellatus SS14]|nr:hypothetical protein M422DRAFT_238937 [Sphaerobolus stellatus SS14]